jgi:dodecin
MSVAKVSELSATSTKSFDAAIAEGIAKGEEGSVAAQAHRAKAACLARRSSRLNSFANEGGHGAPIS